jgi:hypothetical protein
MWIAIPFLASWAALLGLAWLPIHFAGLSLWFYPVSLALLDLLLTQLSIRLKGCLVGQPMWLLEWVRARIHHQQILTPNSHPSRENCIFAVHPHHVYNLGMMLNFIKPFEQGLLLREQYGQAPVPLIADTVFLIRFLAEYLRLSGCEAISSETIERHLSNGRSVAISPGGTSEMALNRDSVPGSLRVIKRLGFLRIAFRLHKPVIPVLVINEEKCYRHYFSKAAPSSLIRRMFDYPFPLVSLGTAGTILPLKTDWVFSVFGAPVDPRSYCTHTEFENAYYDSLVKLATKYKYQLTFIATGASNLSS